MNAQVHKWKLLSGLLLVFVLGILVGSIGAGFYLKYRSAAPERGPRARKDFIINRLSKELNLTPAQKTKIGPIIEQMIEKRRDYYMKIRPEVKSIMEQGFSQIEQELNEDQQKKLKILREKFEKRRKKKRARRLGK
jgi:hypothetical protein